MIEIYLSQLGPKILVFFETFSWKQKFIPYSLEIAFRVWGQDKIIAIIIMVQYFAMAKRDISPWLVSQPWEGKNHFLNRLGNSPGKNRNH